MQRVIEDKASEFNYEQLSQEMILGPTPNLGGKIGSDIYNEAKKITLLRHVGVRKSKLLAMPIHLDSKEEIASSSEVSTKVNA